MNDLYRPQFLPDLLLAALNRNADKPCIFVDDRALTGRELAEQISRYLQAYRSAGMVPGSAVSTLTTNRPEVVFAMGGNMYNPSRLSLLHTMGSLDDHAYVIEDAGIETLIFDPAFEERAQDLKDRVPTLTRFLSFGPSTVGVDLMALAESFEPMPLVPPIVDGEATSGIAYTGGTTGKPKGVMVTYRGTSTMAQIMFAEWQWPDEVRHLVCTPMSHAGSAFLVPVLLHGGSLVVLPRFDPGAVLDAIEEHRITTMMLVPSMLYMLLDHPDINTRDLSSLETVFYGASPMNPTRLKEAIDRFGKIFFQFYGQTESPQTVCVLRKEEHDTEDFARLTSCGRPVPWMRVGLLDDNGDEVSKGESGELCVQGPLIMKGYWNKPDETAEALAGGWLHTGDVARSDDEGYLTIVDRKKDMIVSGGFNIFPREVEDVIATHPAIAVVGVVGVPDDTWGEAVKAVVVLRPGAELEVDELIALVKERKGPHHAPKSVDIVDQIPLSLLGKPDKKALRALYWADSQRGVN